MRTDAEKKVWHMVGIGCGRGPILVEPQRVNPITEAKTRLVSQFAIDKPVAEMSPVEAKKLGKLIRKRYAESVPAAERRWSNVWWLSAMELPGVVHVRYVGDLPARIRKDGNALMALSMCG